MTLLPPWPPVAYPPPKWVENDDGVLMPAEKAIYITSEDSSVDLTYTDLPPDEDPAGVGATQVDLSAAAPSVPVLMPAMSPGAASIFSDAAGAAIMTPYIAPTTFFPNPADGGPAYAISQLVMAILLGGEADSADPTINSRLPDKWLTTAPGYRPAGISPPSHRLQ